MAFKGFWQVLWIKPGFLIITVCIHNVTILIQIISENFQ